MTEIEELEKRADIELARLGVAEDLAWWIAICAAIAAYLRWESWLLAIAIVIGGYFAITYPYRKRESAAEDAHHRVAGLGKYYQPRNHDSA